MRALPFPLLPFIPPKDYGGRIKTDWRNVKKNKRAALKKRNKAK